MWPYSEVIRMILLGTVCLPVEGINFDRDFFGVEFIPFIKDMDENGDFTPRNNYTFQNVRTMLEVVSTKFSRIMTYGVDAPDVPYVKNDTYYKSTVRARTAEAAALINCERRNKTFTVFIGYYQSSSVINRWSDTQLYVAVEAAEIANLIYPGTVDGIFFVNYNKVGVTDPVLWIKKLRGMTKDLGLKVGKVIKGEEHEFKGSKLFWNINAQEVAFCDFIVYSHSPQYRFIDTGTDSYFFTISHNFRQFQRAITEINNKTKVMWHAYSPLTYDGFGYTRNLTGFWERVNKFGMEEKFFVYLRGPFNIHRFYGTDVGWWRLTKNHLIDTISGYEENISGKSVQVNHEPIIFNSLQCFQKDEEITRLYPALYNFSDPNKNGNLPEDITLSSQSITNSSNSSVTPTSSFSSLLQLKKEDENSETFSSVFDDDLNISLQDSDDLNSSRTPETLLNFQDRNEDGQSLKCDFQKNAIIIGGTCIVITILGLISYIIFTRRKLNLLKVRAEMELKETKFEHRNSFDESHADKVLEAQPNSSLELPEDMPFEHPKKNFDILWDEQLGTGQFGLVYKAILRNANGRLQDVAIKLPKQDCIPTALQGLVSEIKILIYLGQHPNIVSLCATYISEINNGVVYLALQLCPLGSLRKHLKSLRKADKRFYDFSVPSTSTTRHDDKDTRIPMLDLMSWSYEIACGMEYLEEKKVVHADLATRNVLLTADKTAKITDFGLSRRLDEDIAYRNSCKGSLLPWRWMAIESLETSQFSVKTDVWSYGVTLWEIFSLGDLPFPRGAYDEAFIRALKSGLRLKQPKLASNDLHELMATCWHLDPDKRPIFTHLRAKIKVLIDQAINSDSGHVYSEFQE